MFSQNMTMREKNTVIGKIAHSRNTPSIMHSRKVACMEWMDCGHVTVKLYVQCDNNSYA